MAGLGMKFISLISVAFLLLLLQLTLNNKIWSLCETGSALK